MPDDSPVCPNINGSHIDPGNFSRWRTSFFVKHGLGHWATETERTDKRGIKHQAEEELQQVEAVSQQLEALPARNTIVLDNPEHEAIVRSACNAYARWLYRVNV